MKWPVFALPTEAVANLKQWRPIHIPWKGRGRKMSHRVCYRRDWGLVAIVFLIVLCQASGLLTIQIGKNRRRLKHQRKYHQQISQAVAVQERKEGVSCSASGRKFDGGKVADSSSLLKLDLARYEEKEKNEMEWLVRTTETFLSREKSSLPMKSGQIRRTFLLMRAWAKRSWRPESNAPYVVERILQSLKEERDAGNHKIHINTKTYNILLDAWSQSNDERSVERAEEILYEMESEYERGNLSLRPDASSYNACIKLYVKKGRRDDSVNKTEAILNRMVEVADVAPNRRGYNLLLYALANSQVPDAAERAEAILRKMIEDFAAGDGHVKPDINTFNQVISSFARGRTPGFEERMQSIYEELLDLPIEMAVEPNTDTFNAVMGGWFKSDSADALEKILDALSTMEAYYAAGNSSAKPDRVTMNTMIAAYAKSGNAESVDRAIELREKMEKKLGISPGPETNNCMIDCWRQSGRSEAPERVLEILDAMESDFKRGKVSMKPDAFTYSSIVDCFTKGGGSDAPFRAEEVLERMRDLYRSHGGDPASVSVYNAVINAWACSKSSEAVDRALALLTELEESEDLFVPKPCLISYNTVIKSMRNGSKEAAIRAEELLRALEQRARNGKGFGPDVFSYTAVISAFGRSDAVDKEKKALEILGQMISTYQRGSLSSKLNIHPFNAALNACAFVEGDEARKLEAFPIVLTIVGLMNMYARPDHTTYGTLLRVCSSLLPSSDKRRERSVYSIFRKACKEGLCGKLVLQQMKFAARPDQYKALVGHDAYLPISLKDLPREWTCNVRERVKSSL